MVYSETINYLFSRLPMYHRIGPPAYRADLKNILELTEILHHPEKKFNSVHIAGTNGKGSVSAMLASIMQEAGYKTGLFTSPHLKDFRERIRINGIMIPEKEVIDFVERYDKSFDGIEPSFFEWTTALAFNFFAEQQVDVAIIETGLGGRLDSTNIITPELSVITNISYDHMQLLGDTLEKIALEKAGIIKKNIPVVIGENQKETAGVFKDNSERMQSPISFASENYKAELLSSGIQSQVLRIFKKEKLYYDALELTLTGNYQQKNIITTMQSVEILNKRFPNITEEAIRKGLRNVKKNTGLSGRWEIIGEDPLVIADVAHNEDGIRSVMNQLKDIVKSKDQNTKLHIVFGVVNDKDPVKVLSLLPVEAIFYFCKADIPRAMDAVELKKIAAENNLIGESYPSVAFALNAAMTNAEKDDIVFVGGSTFVVAEII